KIESDLADKAFQIDHLDDQLEEYQKELEKIWEELLQRGARLSEKRTASFDKFGEAIAALLAQLGMENAAIQISHRTIEPIASGMDEVEIMFSANKGVKPQPIRQVASGGEFSRLMFAIKYIMA